MIEFQIPTIPGEHVILASFLASVFIAYQSRMNGLDTWREREQFIRDKLKEKAHFSRTTKIEISTVEVHEQKGLLYRILKFLTGNLKGHSNIVVKYNNRDIHPDFWESDGAQKFLDMFDFEIEHLSTATYTDPSVSQFKIESVDAADIQEFAARFVKADEFIIQSRINDFNNQRS